MNIYINDVEYYLWNGILYYKGGADVVLHTELVSLILQLSNKMEELEA